MWFNGGGVVLIPSRLCSRNTILMLFGANPFSIFQTWMIQYRSRLRCRDRSLSLFRRSQKSRSWQPAIFLVKFLWMFFNALMSCTLEGLQTKQQYSSLLRTTALYRVIMMKVERSLNTLSTHEAIFLPLWTVCSVWGDHERSLDRRTPRSRTDLAGSMTCPFSCGILLTA